MAQGFGSDIPPAVNQTAKRYIRGMMKGRQRWNRLYGTRSKEVMHKTANKMAMGEMQKMPPTYNEIFGEANKSGDSSLRDWFSKSRSSDGTPGWVQLGGKYAGKPCAKQPGQTTKPKCGSSKMKRDLNSGEEERAFRRKNAEDPNPNRKGKAINVKTEATYPQDFKGGSGVAKKKKGKPNAQGDYGKKDLNERGDFWHPDEKEDRKLGGPGANQRAREDRASRSSSSSSKPDPKKLRPGESYMDYAKRQGKKSAPAPKPKERKRDKIGRAIGRVVDRVAGIKSEARDPYAIGMAQAMKSTGDTPPLEKSTIKKAHKIAKAIKKEEVELEWLTEEQFDEAAGEKDACYKKVKSRYKVWPSAYASGALVKCRKVGAANWGNKSEGVSFQEFQEKALKCWKGCRRVPGTTPGAKGSCTCEDTVAEGAAWTKKAGKNSEGGLNEKGRKSYERENPGSDLKAPSKKVGNPRRASFCARMKGMKKKLTSSKTANDPDSRINKSLRAWNC